MGIFHNQSKRPALNNGVVLDYLVTIEATEYKRLIKKADIFRKANKEAETLEKRVQATFIKQVMSLEEMQPAKPKRKKAKK